MLNEKKFYVVYCPSFRNKMKVCLTFGEAVEKVKAYADSSPGNKFYIAEIIGGYKNTVKEYDLQEIEMVD